MTQPNLSVVPPARHPNTMRAVVQDRYGRPEDVLRLAEVDAPTMGAQDVMVHVVASTVTSGDRRMSAADYPGPLWFFGRLYSGVFRPRTATLGNEFAGVVVAVGDAVTQFAVGDNAFGFAGTGAHADLLVVREDGCIAPKPEHLDFAEAASTTFGGMTAQTFLVDLAGVSVGQKVCVIGASGGVGVMAVQLAKHLGTHVTGVCSTANVDMVRSLGADDVIDYKCDRLADRKGAFDVVFDAAGVQDFGADMRGILADGGRFFSVATSAANLWGALTSSKQCSLGFASETPEDFQRLRTLLQGGALRPVIGRRFALDDIAAAHAYVGTGRKVGSCVVDVNAAPAAGSEVAA